MREKDDQTLQTKHHAHPCSRSHRRLLASINVHTTPADLSDASPHLVADCTACYAHKRITNYGAKVLHDLRWVVADIVPAEIQLCIARGEKPIESETPLYVNGVLTELPLATHPLIREYASFYLDWLAHPTADEYWLPASPQTGYERR